MGNCQLTWTIESDMMVVFYRPDKEIAFWILKGKATQKPQFIHNFSLMDFGWFCTSLVSYNGRSIADVANSKRHQRLDEILIIFTRTVQEISKVVCKKTMSETRTFLGKLMLYETRALQQVYAAQTGLS